MVSHGFRLERGRRLQLFTLREHTGFISLIELKFVNNHLLHKLYAVIVDYVSATVIGDIPERKRITAPRKSTWEIDLLSRQFYRV